VSAIAVFFKPAGFLRVVWGIFAFSQRTKLVKSVDLFTNHSILFFFNRTGGGELSGLSLSNLTDSERNFSYNMQH
jgi:hypothetical protein